MRFYLRSCARLSRPFRALALWLSLRFHGLQSFRDAIRVNLEQAQRLAAAVKSCAPLELATPAELSAVCFRHLVSDRATEEERNQFNVALLKKLVSRGRIYLSNAELKGKFCLRACIVNHLTTDADIDEVVPEVLTAASEVLMTTS